MIYNNNNRSAYEPVHCSTLVVHIMVNHGKPTEKVTMQRLGALLIDSLWMNPLGYATVNIRVYHG